MRTLILSLPFPRSHYIPLTRGKKFPHQKRLLVLMNVSFVYLFVDFEASEESTLGVLNGLRPVSNVASGFASGSSEVLALPLRLSCRMRAERFPRVLMPTLMMRLPHVLQRIRRRCISRLEFLIEQLTVRLLRFGLQHQPDTGKPSISSVL